MRSSTRADGSSEARTVATVIGLDDGLSGAWRVFRRTDGTPALPPRLPLAGQLRGRAGECWESRFTAAGVRASAPAAFSGRGD